MATVEAEGLKNVIVKLKPGVDVKSIDGGSIELEHIVGNYYVGRITSSDFVFLKTNDAVETASIDDTTFSTCELK
jgi:hypothetical protein